MQWADGLWNVSHGAWMYIQKWRVGSQYQHSASQPEVRSRWLAVDFPRKSRHEQIKLRHFKSEKTLADGEVDRGCDGHRRRHSVYSVLPQGQRQPYQLVRLSIFQRT